MDKLSQERRSWNMSRIKSKNTAPELYIRSLLHRNGYRFRLHVKNLPGKPDIVLPKYKTIIEVRGCFWHHHSKCVHGKVPATNHDWWQQKLQGNKQRDAEHTHALILSGWRVMIIWECLLKGKAKDAVKELSPVLSSFITDFLSSSQKTVEVSPELFSPIFAIKSDKSKYHGGPYEI